MSSSNKKRSDLINLALGLFIVVIINVLSQYAFTRIDLTAEKRYTLAPSTKDMLRKLDDLVYFKVYLDGEFPQGAGDYKRLRDETRIMLDEFRAFGGDNIQYEFIDPYENPDVKEQTKFQKQLFAEGMIPQMENFEDNGSQVTKRLFPWAVASYHGQQVLIPLMGSSSPNANEVQLNHAVEGLEYEISNAMRKLQMHIKPKIAITQGHGEPDTIEISDLVKSLREYYDVDYVKFNENLNAFRDTAENATQIYNKYNAIIIDSPDSTYSPKELFILDQFIMYGGKALLLVDPVNTNLDSLKIRGITYGLPRPLGLEELTFRYGARLNSTLVEDVYCADLAIPVDGAQQQFMPMHWYYSPTIQPTEDNPIVKNLDRIKFDFISTVDTVETSANIKKTILLKSSDKSRFQRTPVRISLQMAQMERDERSFNKPYQPVAVLLEGKFDSYFKNKFLPDTIKNSKVIGYKDHGVDSKIIVVGDGDVARNPVFEGKAFPLGYDLLNRLNRTCYANKNFLLNCMNYLFDDKGLLAVRSRDVTLRMLDRGKIKDHRLKWQLINTLGPITFIILFGLFQVWARRKRYIDGMEFPHPQVYVTSFCLALISYFIFRNNMHINTVLIVAITFIAAVFINHKARKKLIEKMRSKQAE
jgi:ABC-2 type transport system permease protein